LLGAFDLAALAALSPEAIQAPAIAPGRQALPPGRQSPLRFPFPGLKRQATQAQPSQARIPQPAANRKTSIFNRANAALEPAA
jgi:hypothetical protein